jgi:hypothetical protein
MIVNLLLAAPVLGASFAVAQQDPSDRLGLGTKLGIAMMNQSGQVGAVTLFNRGARTFVDVSIQGVPAGKVERVAIHRNRDCDQPIEAVAAYPLEDLRNGRSRTLLNASSAKLLSGNYSLIVASTQKKRHLFACGHLYR